MMTVYHGSTMPIEHPKILAAHRMLDFVHECRMGNQDNDAYDLVCGPMANDNVYNVLTLYESGILSREETLDRLKVRDLYNQILFHTDEALAFCDYVDNKEVQDNG